MTVPPHILAAIRQPAFLWGADGRVAAANDLAEGLAGRPLAGCTPAEIVALFRARTPGGEPLSPAKLPASRALAGEEVVDLPMAITAADGRVVRLLVTASPLRDGDALAGALAIWQDVSALEAARAEPIGLRRESEATTGDLRVQGDELRQQGTALAAANEALDRQRRLLDAILGAVPYRVSLWGRDERIVWVNERFAAERGEPREALVGRSWRELGDPLDVVEPLVREALEAVMAGATVAREVEVAGTASREWRACTFMPFGRDAVLVVTGDVSERRRAEQALAEEHELLERLIETVPVMISIHDPALGRFHLNRAVEEVLGYTDEDAADGRLLERTYPDPSDRAAVEAFMRSLEPGWRDMTVTARDGSAVPTSWANFRLSNEVEVGVGIDLRERTRMEAALRESEAKYRNLVELSPDAILIHQEGTIVFANAAAAALLGAGAPDELCGRRILELVHPDSRADVEANIAADLRGEESPRTPIEMVRLDGTTVSTQGRGAMIPFGGRPALQVVLRDVTVERAVETALRESEERLRLAQEGAAIGVWDWDVRTGLYTSTPEFFRLYGLEEGRTLTYAQWRERVHPDDVEWAESESQAALARGEPFHLEHRIVRPSGEVRWLSASGRGYYDDRGTLIRVIGTNLDITDRKEAEAELARSAEDLARSNEELQRFAYVASHDLQEPLRSIVSFSQLLERRYKGKLDSDADEYIEFIVEGGTRMQTLIRDLLQVSRVETEAKPLAPTDPAAVVYAAARSLDEAIRGAGATVTVGDMPTVMADAAQIEQVFSNLIGNAVKYRREGVPPVIAISARRLNGRVEFSVADNGIGIEAEYFDRIFQMFQRLHTHDEYEGTGIGLAVVKKIVDRHGGRIRVESTPGEGSTFFFTLPAA